MRTHWFVPFHILRCLLSVSFFFLACPRKGIQHKPSTWRRSKSEIHFLSTKQKIEQHHSHHYYNFRFIRSRIHRLLPNDDCWCWAMSWQVCRILFIASTHTHTYTGWDNGILIDSNNWASQDNDENGKIISRIKVHFFSAVENFLLVSERFSWRGIFCRGISPERRFVPTKIWFLDTPRPSPISITCPETPTKYLGERNCFHIVRKCRWITACFQ